MLVHEIFTEGAVQVEASASAIDAAERMWSSAVGCVVAVTWPVTLRVYSHWFPRGSVYDVE